MTARLILALALCLMLGVSSATAKAVGNGSPHPRREMAVTFDDLPFWASGRKDPEVLKLSARLLKEITKNGIPAVGFVNEGRLYPSGELDTQLETMLEDWLAAGLELGNHTFSHGSLTLMPLADYMHDVVRGEIITKQLMAKHKKKLRYFRHPFLEVGKDAKTRAEFEKFLADRGYIIAPVTINSAEWVFGEAYDIAERQGDEAAMKRVAKAYVPYMEQVIDDAEKQSVDLFGHEIKQILLLHATALNAACLNDLVAMIKRRGYSFITLDEAMQDRAYGSPNTYSGEEGESWLNQWAYTLGLRPDRDRDVPALVRSLVPRPVFGY